MKKRLIAIILSVMMVVGLMVFPTSAADINAGIADWYDTSWYNNSDTFFEISTAKQLYGLAVLTYAVTNTTDLEAITNGKTFKLTADIDLNPGWSADSGSAAPVEFPGILRFCGTLDGQGHTISGLYMATASNNLQVTYGGKAYKATDNSKTSKNDIAFIGRVMDATIQNLVMVNGLVKNGSPFIGTVSGNTSPAARTVFGVTVENVYVDVDCDRSTDSEIGTSYMAGIIHASYFNQGTKSESRDAWIVLKNVVYAGTLSSTCKITYNIGGIFGYLQLRGTKDGATTEGTMIMQDVFFAGSFGDVAGSTTNPLIGKKGTFNNTSLTQTNCYSSKDQVKLNPLSKGRNSFSDFLQGDTKTTVRNAIGFSSDYLGVYDISWYNDRDTVFEISTAAQLYGLAYLIHTQTTIATMEGITAGKVFKLTADIDLNPGWSADSGTAAVEFPGIVRFCGTLDGQGYTISGLYMATRAASIKVNGLVANRQMGINSASGTVAVTSEGDYGFIGRIIGGTVQNLIMLNGLVKNGGAFVGTVSGGAGQTSMSVTGARLVNIYVDVDASRGNSQNANYLGGIINTSFITTGTALNENGYYIYLRDVVYAGNLSASVKLTYGIGGITAYMQLSGANGNATMCVKNVMNAGTITDTTDGSSNTIYELIGVRSSYNANALAINDYCVTAAVANGEGFLMGTAGNVYKETKNGMGILPAGVAEMVDTTKNVVVQRSNAVENETSFSIRLLLGVDDLNWKNVGFRIQLIETVTENEVPTTTTYMAKNYTVTEVYTSIRAAGTEVAASSDLLNNSTYVYGIVINNIPVEGTVTFRVTPIKETTSGWVLCYQSRMVEVTYENGILQIDE